ncbi:RebB family R body protein [Oceanibacterium hippocampi]|uniref:Killing trait n=1 Tax=Oceanibacterium hippocampi TaxID=745714 RepID=A0A1Y5T7Q2_9PROT|nr:RebB family R body protein [Oceanibacterium hippocampi]SLN57794.1 Killing trait [Oceanibacterium hippocampi]
MADNTHLNSQITDAVTQSNLQLLGSAPAESMAMLYQMLAQSTGLSMQNTIANQQHKNSLESAVVTQAVNLLFSVDTATAGRATDQIFSGNSVANQMDSLKAALATFKS